MTSSGLDALPLFASLDARSRARLAATGEERAYPRGASLFRAGTEPIGIYVVLSGKVRVLGSRDGRQFVVHEETAGGTLAEIPFFEGGRLPATAVAASPTRCLILPRASLRKAIDEDPAIAWLFLRRLAVRIRQVVSRLDGTATQSIPSRLATYLLSRADKAGRVPFSLGMTQAELAEELATVREVVVRSLAKLRKEKLIASARRGCYLVVNRRALERLANPS